MADAQKEGFRKYLEAAGVIDALTKGAIAAHDSQQKFAYISVLSQHTVSSTTCCTLQS